ncbi:MAG: hypothetical protein KDH96_10990 [Candidatus Riesia sp.]|nr:hypothetical protein [Candidatus Riesia sp.]
MGKKNKSHRVDRRNLIKVFVFAGATALSSGAFVYGMVQNGNGAVELYNKLIATDKAGGDVTTALNELRSYIYSHMNTEIGGPNGIYPPIQLQGTYDRLVTAEQSRVKEINDNLYSEAQSFCEVNGNQGYSGRNRIDCINEYIDNHGAKEQTIDDSFYKYDFVSPRWSPDLAGYSLIAVIIFSLITLFHLLAYLRTKYFVNF